MNKDTIIYHNQGEYVLEKLIDQKTYERLYIASYRERDGAELVHQRKKLLRLVTICDEGLYRTKSDLSDVDPDLFFENVREKILEEVRCQKELGRTNPGFLPIQDYWIEGSEKDITVVIVMDYGEPLSEQLGDLGEHEENQMVLTLAKTLQRCHKDQTYVKSIGVHQVFMDVKGLYVLGNLELSNLVDPEDEVYEVFNSATAAPELRFSKPDQLSDLYSFGSFIYFLFNHNTLPYYEKTLGVVDYMKKNDYDKLENPCEASEEESQIILKLLAQPDKRISSIDVFLDLWDKRKQDVVPEPEKPKSHKWIIAGVVVILAILFAGKSLFSGGGSSKADAPKPTIETQESTEAATKSESALESSVEFVYEDNVLVAYRGQDVDVKVPDGVVAIGAEAFKDNYTIESVTIPEGVTEIGDKAFQNCMNLKEASLPDSVMSIGEEAFMGTMMEAVALPEKLTSIGDNAFNGCNALKDVTFGGDLKSIGKSAFANCRNLTEIHLGENVDSIGDYAFQLCKSLYSFEIKSMNGEIGNDIFSGCSVPVKCMRDSDMQAYAIENGLEYELIE